MLVNGTYIKADELFTTTSSTMDWSFFEDDDSMGDIPDDRRKLLLLNQGRGDHAGLKSAEQYENAVVDSTVTAMKDIKEEKEEDKEGPLVNQMSVTALRQGPLELSSAKEQESHFELMAMNSKERDYHPSDLTIRDGGKVQGGKGLEKVREWEDFGLIKNARMLGEGNVEEPVATVSIEKGSFIVSGPVQLCF